MTAELPTPERLTEQDLAHIEARLSALDRTWAGTLDWTSLAEELLHDSLPELLALVRHLTTKEETETHVATDWYVQMTHADHWYPCVSEKAARNLAEKWGTRVKQTTITTRDYVESRPWEVVTTEESRRIGVQQPRGRVFVPSWSLYEGSTVRGLRRPFSGTDVRGVSDV